MALLQLKDPYGTIFKKKGISFSLWVSISSLYKLLKAMLNPKPSFLLPYFNLQIGFAICLDLTDGEF